MTCCWNCWKFSKLQFKNLIMMFETAVKFCGLGGSKLRRTRINFNWIFNFVNKNKRSLAKNSKRNRYLSVVNELFAHKFEGKKLIQDRTKSLFFTKEHESGTRTEGFWTFDQNCWIVWFSAWVLILLLMSFVWLQY